MILKTFTSQRHLVPGMGMAHVQFQILADVESGMLSITVGK